MNKWGHYRSALKALFLEYSKIRKNHNIKCHEGNPNSSRKTAAQLYMKKHTHAFPDVSRHAKVHNVVLNPNF